MVSKCLRLGCELPNVRSAYLTLPDPPALSPLFWPVAERDSLRILGATWLRKTQKVGREPYMMIRFASTINLKVPYASTNVVSVLSRLENRITRRATPAPIVRMPVPNHATSSAFYFHDICNRSIIGSGKTINGMSVTLPMITCSMYTGGWSMQLSPVKAQSFQAASMGVEVNCTESHTKAKVATVMNPVK